MRLARGRDLKQAFEQGPARLAEEVVGAAFVAARRFGNERSRERRCVSLIVSLAQFQPRRPVGTAFIDRVQDQVSAHRTIKFGDVFALGIDHDRELAARLYLSKQRADRHRLSSSGRSRDEEVFAFSRARNSYVGERDSHAVALKPGAAKFAREPAGTDQAEASHMLPLGTVLGVAEKEITERNESQARRYRSPDAIRRAPLSERAPQIEAQFR